MCRGVSPLLTETPVERFIKPNVSRGDHLSSGWVPYKITVGVVGIPDECAYESCAFHFAAVIRWYVDVGWTTKNTEVLKIRGMAYYGQDDWNAFNAGVVCAIV